MSRLLVFMSQPVSLTSVEDETIYSTEVNDLDDKFMDEEYTPTPEELEQDKALLFGSDG